MGKITASFLAHMEMILWLYSLSYDHLYPVVCFDERPCFLIEDIVSPLPMRMGILHKEHYAYQKNGSCVLLAAIEPLTGKRIVQVKGQRTKKEYAYFMKNLAANYPEAKKIRLVQDNLNTHYISSFYEHFTADEALRLAKRFEFYYTPKSASCGSPPGLNIIEIEFSALARQCLHRRIATQKQLEREVVALVEERNQNQTKINWQFSVHTARQTLNRHYIKVNSVNQLYQKT